MRQLAGISTLTATLVALVALLAGGVTGAQPVRPDYRPYAEFTADDTAEQVTLKQAYNKAVQRYNDALYEYHVTLEKHDQLVESYNASPNLTDKDRQRLREQAGQLRTRLTALRREVATRAAAMDEAARRAVGAGASLTH